MERFKALVGAFSKYCVPQNLVDTFNCYWAYIGRQQLGVGLHVQFEVLTHGGKLHRSEVSAELSIFCLQ